MAERVTTVDDIKQFFFNLIQKEYDLDQTLFWLNQADGELRTSRDWAIFKKIDASETLSQGNTYLNLRNLPADFMRPVSDGVIYLDTLPILQIPFTDRQFFKDTPNRWYIDFVNNKWAITGNASGSRTIFFPYIYRTLPLQYDDTADEIVNTKTPSWWPVEHRPVLAYRMAKLYQGNRDPDDLAFRLSRSQEAEYQRLMDLLEDWDADIRVAAMGGRAGFDQRNSSLGLTPGNEPHHGIKLGDM